MSQVHIKPEFGLSNSYAVDVYGRNGQWQSSGVDLSHKEARKQAKRIRKMLKKESEAKL